MPMRRERYVMGTDPSCDVLLKIPDTSPFHASLTRVDDSSNDIMLACEATDHPVVIYPASGDKYDLVHGAPALRLSYRAEFSVGTRRFRYDRPDAPCRPYPPPQPATQPVQSLRTHGVLRPRDSVPAEQATKPPTKKAAPTPAASRTQPSRQRPQPPPAPSRPAKALFVSAKTAKSSLKTARPAPPKPGTINPRVKAPDGCLLLFTRGKTGEKQTVTAAEVAHLCKQFHVGYQVIIGLMNNPESQWRSWQYGGIVDAETGELRPNKKPIREEPPKPE